MKLTDGSDAKLCTPKDGPESKNWLAYLNKMPGDDVSFYTTGLVNVDHYGQEPILKKTTPQGFNPNILLLDLKIVELPGEHIQMPTYKPVRFDEKPAIEEYDSVLILWNGKPFETIFVQVVQ